MKHSLTLIALAVAALSSCKKAEPIAQLTITDQIQMSIPATAASATPFEMYSQPVYSDASQQLTNNDTKAEMVQSARLKEFRMNITQPLGESWEFLNDIEVFIAADQLSEKKIAFQYQITGGTVAALLLKTENIDLSEYIKKGTYIVKARLTTSKDISNEINVNIISRYLVDAKKTSNL